MAIYVVVDDPQSGTLVKLSGHVIPDPETGRLTTVFDENPQLPFDSFKLDFFGGAERAASHPRHLRHLLHHLADDAVVSAR